MRYLLLSLILSFSLFADYTVKTHVIDVEDNGDRESLDVLVSYGGRIFKVQRERTELIESLKLAKEVGYKVQLDLVTNFISEEVLGEVELISKVQLLSSDKRNLEESDNFKLDELRDDPISPTNNFHPTDVRSYQRASRIFDDLTRAGRTKEKSECFNRAYVWSKYMHKKFGVRSYKLLLYYSRKYRRQIRGSKWWFHITPVVKVGSELYAMDRKFHRNPYTMHNWQNSFTAKIPNRQYDCKIITHYSEYKKNYENPAEWCFLQLTSMYYWEPNDIRRVERTGREMKYFSNYILRRAARQGFRRASRVYRELRDY